MSNVDQIKKLFEAELDAIAREFFPTRFWSGYHVDKDDRKRFLDTLQFERCSDVPTQEVRFYNDSQYPVDITHRPSALRQRTMWRATVSVPIGEVGGSEETESEHTSAMEDAGAIPVHPPNTGGAYLRYTGSQIIWYKVSAREPIKLRVYALKCVKRGAAGGAVAGGSAGGVGGAALGAFIGGTIGTPLPVAGNFLGGLIGGAIGAALGGVGGTATGGAAGTGIGAGISYADQITVAPQDIFKRFPSCYHDKHSGYVYCKVQCHETTTCEATITLPSRGHPANGSTHKSRKSRKSVLALPTHPHSLHK